MAVVPKGGKKHIRHAYGESLRVIYAFILTWLLTLSIQITSMKHKKEWAIHR